MQISLDDITPAHLVLFYDDILTAEDEPNGRFGPRRGEHVRHGHFVRRADEDHVVLNVQDPPMGPPREWTVPIADIQRVVVIQEEPKRDAKPTTEPLALAAAPSTPVVVDAPWDTLTTSDLVAAARERLATSAMSTVTHQLFAALCDRLQNIANCSCCSP